MLSQSGFSQGFYTRFPFIQLGKNMARLSPFLVKLLIFALAFGIVVAFLLKFDEWAGGFRKYLFATGNWEYLAYLVVFALAIGYVLKWLVKKEFHEEFVRKKRR